MTPSQWAPTAPLGVKLALVELLLTELEGSASRCVYVCCVCVCVCVCVYVCVCVRV